MHPNPSYKHPFRSTRLGPIVLTLGDPAFSQSWEPTKNPDMDSMLSHKSSLSWCLEAGGISNDGAL